MTRIHKLTPLKKAAILKTENAVIRVNTALLEMKTLAIPVNFQAVAKIAGVSKSWLYEQTDLADEIRSLRLQSGKIRRTLTDAKYVAQKNIRIDVLEKRVCELESENKQLKHQLEVVYGELHHDIKK